MPHFATDFDQIGPSVRHRIFLLVCGIALDENSWSYHIDFELGGLGVLYSSIISVSELWFGFEKWIESHGQLCKWCRRTVISAFLHRANETNSSTVVERPRCRVSKLWQKYKSEKRASNIALSYGGDVDKWSFYCLTSPCLYLMQNYAAFRR